MADELNYSKRELDYYFKEIKDTLHEQNKVLGRIETQVLKTNGRVTTNEKDISQLKWWKSALVWGFGVLMTIALFTINYFKK